MARYSTSNLNSFWTWFLTKNQKYEMQRVKVQMKEEIYRIRKKQRNENGVLIK